MMKTSNKRRYGLILLSFLVAAGVAVTAILFVRHLREVQTQGSYVAESAEPGAAEDPQALPDDAAEEQRSPAEGSEQQAPEEQDAKGQAPEGKGAEGQDAAGQGAESQDAAGQGAAEPPKMPGTAPTETPPNGPGTGNPLSEEALRQALVPEEQTAVEAAADAFAPMESAPVETMGAEAEKQAAALIETLASGEEPLLREAVGTLEAAWYPEGDAYETAADADGGTVVTAYYHFPTGYAGRVGGKPFTADEEAEQARLQSVLERLFLESAADEEPLAETVFRDFTVMRHWPQTYRDGTGEIKLPWSSYTRGRYYGSRYVLMSVSFDTVTIVCYPEGYADPLLNFARPGEVNDFYLWKPEAKQ